LLKHAREHGLLARISDITPGDPAMMLLDGLADNTQPGWQPGATAQERFFQGFAMLTALLAVFATLSSAGRHSDIRRQVGERTAQLRHELEARSAAEAALHSSEERY